MENAIYNELIVRGNSVDVGVVGYIGARQSKAGRGQILLQTRAEGATTYNLPMSC